MPNSSKLLSCRTFETSTLSHYQPNPCALLCSLSWFCSWMSHGSVLSHIYKQWVNCTLNRKVLSFIATGSPKLIVLCTGYLNTQSDSLNYTVGSTNRAKILQNLLLSGHSQCKWATMKEKIWLKSLTGHICISNLQFSISIFNLMDDIY